MLYLFNQTKDVLIDKLIVFFPVIFYFAFCSIQIIKQNFFPKTSLFP